MYILSTRLTFVFSFFVFLFNLCLCIYYNSRRTSFFPVELRLSLHCALLHHVPRVAESFYYSYGSGELLILWNIHRSRHETATGGIKLTVYTTRANTRILSTRASRIPPRKEPAIPMNTAPQTLPIKFCLNT